MNRKVLIILVIVNSAIFIWSGYNLYLLTDPVLTEVSNGAKEKLPLLQQSVNIIESYTEEQKINNIDKVISLYSSLTDLLDSLNGVVIESIDALYEYAYSYLLVSTINMLLLFYLIYTSRHNKSLNLTGAENAPPS